LNWNHRNERINIPNKNLVENLVNKVDHVENRSGIEGKLEELDKSDND
jgi:hypothetical protein